MTFGKAVLAAAFTLGLASAAQAAYPEKAITVIVPFPAGGPADTVARVVGGKLNESFGQPVVVENRPGATGAIGSVAVAQSKPDGYTLLVAPISVYAINPGLYPNLRYDPRRDFDLLTVAVRTPNVLVTRPDFPANSVAELLEYLKSKPGTVSFATSGTGSSDHLTTELFWQKTNTKGVHVPYKGAAPALTDLFGGHADVSFQNLGTVAGHIKDGKLKLLAVTAGARTDTFPNTPTMAEAGVKGVEVYSWQAVAAPKGLPADVKARLNTGLMDALRNPAVRANFEKSGFEVVANSNEDFATFLNAELTRWKEVIDTGKITPEQ